MLKILITLITFMPFLTYSQSIMKGGKFVPLSGEISFNSGENCEYDIMYLKKDSLFIKFNGDSTFNEFSKSEIDWFRYKDDNKIIYFNVNDNLRIMRIKKDGDSFLVKRGDKSLITGLSLILLGGVTQTLSATLNQSNLTKPLQISSGVLFTIGATISLDGVIKKSKHYNWKMRKSY